MDSVDNADGSTDVTYLPTVPGEYAVHVLCDDEDIVGSPFMVDVQPAPPADKHFDPSKVCPSNSPVHYTVCVILRRLGGLTVRTLDLLKCG